MKLTFTKSKYQALDQIYNKIVWLYIGVSGGLGVFLKKLELELKPKLISS